MSKRARIVQEIVDTERTYVTALTKLQDILEPLVEEHSNPDLVADSKFPINEANTIHSTAGIITGLSKMLLEMLEPRAKDFTEETRISDVFLKLADFMKVYTHYIKAYQPFVTKFLPYWQSRKGQGAVHTVNESANTSDFLNFESCLIVPVQRIPRYQLLINDYLKCTPDDHPDRPDLEMALEKVSSVGTYVNNMQHFYDEINKVMELHKRFGRQLTDDTGVSEFVRSHRRLLKQGQAFLHRPGTKEKPVMIYLLTDLLIVGSLTEAGAEGNKVLSLLCLWLVSLLPELSDDIREKEALVGDSDLLFGFVDEGEEVRLVLQARSLEEKEAWVAAITKSQSDMNHAIRKGSDIESQKVHVAETVQWAKPLMPSEIANALKEVQAEKISSSKAQYRSLRGEETPDLDSPVHAPPPIRDGKKSGSSRIRRVLDRSSGILSSGLLSPMNEPNSAPALSPGVDRPRVPLQKRSLDSHEVHSSLHLELSQSMGNIGSASTPNGSQTMREPSRRRSTVVSTGLDQPATARKGSRIRTGTLRGALPTGLLRRAETHPDDLVGRLFIRVLEARGIKLKHDETITAYVNIQMGSKHFATPVSKKSVHPVWNANNEFIRDMLSTDEGEHFSLDVKLVNKRSKGDRMVGEILIKLSNRVESRFADKWYTLKRENNKTAELRIQLHFKTKQDLEGKEAELDVFETKQAEDLTLSEQRLVDYLAQTGDPLCRK